MLSTISNQQPFFPDLIHSPLELSSGDAVLGDNVHNASPARHGIAIHAAQQRLRQRLEQLIRLQVRLIQGLAHSVEVARAISGHHEVVALDLRSDQVHRRQEGLAFGVQPGDDRLAEVRAESLLVQHGRQQVGENCGRHVALLLELVEVHPEFQQVPQGLHIRGQSAQPHVELGRHLEDLCEVARHRVQLDSQSAVGGNPDAVLARHGHDRGSVVFQN
mmetsp:Transcript_16735/g.46853  ORF Transcript_16735/g.46853 Transcript_16735/m.46853 type:complete len:218 (-) Transcript_16735:135-788(-)